MSSLPVLPPKPGAAQQQQQSEQGVHASSTSDADIVPKHNIDESFLTEYTLEELKELVADKSLLDAVYQTHHASPAQYAETLTGLETRQREIHARLTVLRPDLLEARFEAENALLRQKELALEWESLERQMYLALKPTTADALFERLQLAVNEGEKVSESMLSSFLEPGGPVLTKDEVHEFIKEYRTTRKTCHLRTERLARWKDGRVGGFR